MGTQRRSLRNATINGIKPGTFLKARLSRTGPGGHATIFIEGNDGEELSVAGIGINAQGIDLLIRRLTNLRRNFS